MDVKGKNILIVGMAKSGSAAARLLIRNGANVRITEGSESSAILKEAEKLQSFGAKVEIGAHTRGFMAGSDFIVISPGVPDKCPVVKWANDDLIPIISEIELASRFTKVPIVAVTGTNGKTTTTALIAHILNENGLTAAACGNIGNPLSSAITDVKNLKYAVCEVSSFQLERIVNFRPFISVFLNLTPDHLDRYNSIEEYRDAKINVFKNQDKDDWAVINETCSDFLTPTLEKKGVRAVYFSKGRTFISNFYQEDGKLALNFQNNKGVICCRDEVHLLGDHNLENIFSAAAAAMICGVTVEGVAGALKTFRAVSHRLEYVDNIKGVNFVNDSKGTNVDSVVVALKAFNGKILLIAGGRDKGSDYKPLRDLLKERVKGLVLIGEAADKMADQLEGATKIYKTKTLEDAVKTAMSESASGDTVLLSPACASFDMFKNYEHRGDEFKRIVGELKSL